ncbi:MAG TPA: hypothetical protein PKA00_20900 [Saprospiraceae bacterium]|nr:hypothetical protein [Saprospiraceae bacterium]HMQ85382.1 hypothetical protein [Saprospiraceae bacterium]
MKRLLQLSFLIVITLLLTNTDALAQSRGKKKKSSETDKYFDDSGNFASKLWYGGGFNLGFSGDNFESLFQLGVSPMVGYKITDNFSIGPRGEVLFNFYRADVGAPEIAKGTFVNYGLGVFSRYKIFRTIFIHGEYGFQNEEIIIDYDFNENKFITGRRSRNNAFIGAGYNDGDGVWGYEIALLYNLNQDANTLDLPFDFRFGITYNF